MLILSVLLIVTIFIEFPKKPYNAVANRWFENFTVSPPKDFSEKELREVNIDFISPKEFDKKNNYEFFWISNSGDVLTLTNQNPRPVNAVINFLIETDPCGQNRKVTISTLSTPLEISLLPKKNVEVSFPVSIDQNESIFLTISSRDLLKCTLDGSDTRNFLAKIINPQATIIR